MKSMIVLWGLAIIALASLGKALARSSDPLACYLNSLSYTFPEIDIDLDGKELVITDLTCSNMDLAAIPSAFKPPTTLSMGAKDFKAECTGKYKYGILKQTVTISIVTDIVLDVFVQKIDDYPVFTNFSSCNLTKFDIDIDFSSAILNAFAPMIASAIQKAVFNSICVTLNEVYSSKLTEALVTKIDPKIHDLSEEVPAPYPRYNEHYMDWSNSTYSDLREMLETLRSTTDIPTFLKCMVGSRPAKALGYLVEEELKVLEKIDDIDGWTVWQTVDDVLHEALYNEPIVIIPGISIQILSTRFKGLDTLKDLQIFEPYNESKVVLRTVTDFESLEMQLRAQIVVNASQFSPGCEHYTQDVEFTFAVQNSRLVMDLVLAMDEHLLRSFFMDQLSSVSCWLSTIAEVSLPNVALSLDLTDISVKQIRGGDSGKLESDIVILLDNVLQFLFAPEAFKVTTETIITGVMQGPLRDAVNAKLVSRLVEHQRSNPCLSHYPYDDVQEFLEWPTNQLVQKFDKVMNELISWEGVNEFFTCLTDGTGMLSFYTNLLEIDLKGLNSFYGLSLFAPVANDSNAVFELDNFIAAGYCPDGSGTATCNPLAISISVNPATLIPALLGTADAKTTTMSMAVVPVGVPLEEGRRALLSLPNRTMHFEMTMENFEMELDFSMKIDKDKLKELQFKQLPTTGCKASSVDTMAFEVVTMDVSRADMIFQDGEYHMNVTGGIQALLDFLTREDIVNGKNADIADQLNAAGPTCKNGGVNPLVIDDDVISGGDPNDDWKWQLFVLVIGCTACLAGLLMSYHHWGKAKVASCYAYSMDSKSAADGRPVWERWAMQEALVFHHEIPLWLRVAVPIAIVGVGAMFLCSNMAPDAVSVMVSIVAPDKVYDLGSMFDFGLKSTVGDMWDAEVYTLAVLIAFFSGAWPYVKLAAMMVAWILPPVWLTISQRETVLIVLDALGKWSLIDFFVMVLMLCAFYLNLVLAPQLQVLVTVKPKWGFYSFLLATMMSLGLGHLILACHRLVEEPKVPAYAPEKDPKESLSSLTYEVDMDEPPSSRSTESNSAMDEAPIGNGPPLRRGRRTGSGVLLQQSQAWESDVPTASQPPTKRVMLVTPTQFGKVVVTVVLLATATLVFFGTWLETMGFEFRGLIGLMLKDDAKQDYSYIDVGESIPKHSGIPNDFAVRWMQAAYFLFGMAMPLALMAVLGMLWLVPLTLDRQRQLFVLSEVLNAWSTLDVYCVSIAAALMEIRQFASFIIGDSCDQINAILEKYMDDKLHGDDLCFDVVAYIKPICWTTFLAAGMLLLVGIPMLMIGHHAVSQRLKQSRGLSLMSTHALVGPLSLDKRYGAEYGSDPASNADVTKPLLEDPALRAVVPGEDAGDAEESKAAVGPDESMAASGYNLSSMSRNSTAQASDPRLSGPFRGSSSTDTNIWRHFTWHQLKLRSIFLCEYLRLAEVQVEVVLALEEPEHSVQHPTSTQIVA